MLHQSSIKSRLGSTVAMAWLAGLLSDYDDKTFDSLAFVKKERKNSFDGQSQSVSQSMSRSTTHTASTYIPHNTTLLTIGLLNKVGDIGTSKIVCFWTMVHFAFFFPPLIKESG